MPDLRSIFGRWGAGVMLSWPAALGYGAVGGLAVEAVFTWTRLQAWQHARHAASEAGDQLPAISRFIDTGPDSLVAFSRTALGAVAGWLLHSDVTGVYAAITVGASAPSLLANLGKASTSRFKVPQSEQEGGPAVHGDP